MHKKSGNSDCKTPIHIMQRHLAMYDPHVPQNIPLSPVYDFIKYYKPTHFILGGDFLNLEWASHWNEKQFSLLGWYTVRRWLRQELESGKDVLNKLVKVLPANCERYYIPGNHEEWLRLLGITYPQIFEIADIKIKKLNYKTDFGKVQREHLARLLASHLDLDKFRISVLPYDQPLTIGRINYVHGHRSGGMMPAKTTVEKNKRTTVFGHYHTHQVYTSTSPINSRDTHIGISVPCLSRLGPGYMGVPTSRWLNGFFVANVLPSFHFSHYIIPIVDGIITTPDGLIFS